MKGDCRPSDPRGSGIECGEAAISYYVDLVARLFPNKMKVHIAIDPCCGSAAAFASGLMKDICGAKVSPINDYRSHRFPRDPEPRAGSTSGLQACVRKTGADFGAAFDIDADRVLILDENGTPVPEDITGVMLARNTLRPGDACTAPINSNSLIEETCKKMDVRFEYCGIGQPKIVAKMREMNASYAYEESGKYYVKHLSFACGVLAALTIAEIIEGSGRPLSEHVKAFPRSYMFKKGFECEDGMKAKAIELVLSRWDEAIREKPVKEHALEGMKKVYADGSWVMVRA
jgi:phosphomannomutase